MKAPAKIFKVTAVLSTGMHSYVHPDLIIIQNVTKVQEWYTLIAFIRF